MLYYRPLLISSPSCCEIKLKWRKGTPFYFRGHQYNTPTTLNLSIDIKTKRPFWLLTISRNLCQWGIYELYLSWLKQNITAYLFLKFFQPHAILSCHPVNFPSAIFRQNTLENWLASLVCPHNSRTHKYCQTLLVHEETTKFCEATRRPPYT